jgi:predicted nucleic acid-binding protein
MTKVIAVYRGTRVNRLAGETALDTSVAIRYLKGDAMPTAASYAVARVIALLTIMLPLPIVAKLLFRAENSGCSLQNLTRYLRSLRLVL